MCTSPLPTVPVTDTYPPAHSAITPSQPQLLGSYHQTYRLDNKLIALSVLDLLPHAVSGVYFIYDADYAKYSFGKLSALREAAFALEGGYEYYYMGFYIHDCVKMRYKGEYRPQWILDPETYEWNMMDDSTKKMLSEKRYITSAPNAAQGEEESGHATVEEHTGPNEGEENKSPTPTLAASSNLSLLSFGFAGTTSLPDLLAKSNLGATPFLYRQGSRQMLIELQNLVSWEEGDWLDPHSIKGAVTELAACLGVEVAGEMCIDFGQ